MHFYDDQPRGAQIQWPKILTFRMFHPAATDAATVSVPEPSAATDAWSKWELLGAIHLVSQCISDYFIGKEIWILVGTAHLAHFWADHKCLMDSYGFLWMFMLQASFWACPLELWWWSLESPTACPIYVPKLGIHPRIPVAYHICPPFKVVICGNIMSRYVIFWDSRHMIHWMIMFSKGRLGHAELQLRAEPWRVVQSPWSHISKVKMCQNHKNHNPQGPSSPQDQILGNQPAKFGKSLWTLAIATLNGSNFGRLLGQFWSRLEGKPYEAQIQGWSWGSMIFVASQTDNLGYVSFI